MALEELRCRRSLIFQRVFGNPAVMATVRARTPSVVNHWVKTQTRGPYFITSTGSLGRQGTVLIAARDIWKSLCSNFLWEKSEDTQSCIIQAGPHLIRQHPQHGGCEFDSQPGSLLCGGCTFSLLGSARFSPGFPASSHTPKAMTVR